MATGAAGGQTLLPGMGGFMGTSMGKFPQWAIYDSTRTVVIAEYKALNGWNASRVSGVYPTGLPVPQPQVAWDIMVYAPSNAAEADYYLTYWIEAPFGSTQPQLFTVIYTSKTLCDSPGSCNCSEPRCLCIAKD